MTLLFVETPFLLTMEVSVKDTSMVLHQQFNLSMSPEDREAEFVGYLA
ncbi:hypothetical protein [Paenibacillus helianthi]|nr:hypothetical protein [Paenibacillus helianthi]